jgi:hypothetical protein
VCVTLGKGEGVLPTAFQQTAFQHKDILAGVITQLEREGGDASLHERTRIDDKSHFSSKLCILRVPQSKHGSRVGILRKGGGG